MSILYQDRTSSSTTVDRCWTTVHTEEGVFAHNDWSEAVSEETERFAPYAPAVAVLGVIRRMRQGRLPDPLTLEELTRVGVSEGNSHRTMRALRFLELVDDDGRRTATFERLARATSAEYPDALGESLRKMYGPVFEVVDPATASDVELQDAFRGFEPQGQRDRMVALFQGLCREAGLIPGGPLEFAQRRKPRPAASPGRSGEQPLARHPIPDRAQVGEPGSGQGAPSVTSTYAPLRPDKSNGPRVDYSVLDALLRQLPDDGRWTKARKDRWLRAVEVNIDLLVEVIEDHGPRGAGEGFEGVGTDDVGVASP